MEGKGTISVVVHKDATAYDIFQSFIHALVMAYVPDQKSRHLESMSWMDQNYEGFIQKVKFKFLYVSEVQKVAKFSFLCLFLLLIKSYKIFINCMRKEKTASKEGYKKPLQQDELITEG